MQKKANARIAHLVFADTQANPEKPKELFLANALAESTEEKVSLKTNKGIKIYGKKEQ